MFSQSISILAISVIRYEFSISLTFWVTKYMLQQITVKRKGYATIIDHVFPRKSRIDEFHPHRNVPMSPNLVFSCLQIVINTFTTVIMNYAFETEEKVFGIISVFHEAMNQPQDVDLIVWKCDLNFGDIYCILRNPSVISSTILTKQ